MIKVINLPYEYEPILGFLYPDYCITDSMALTSKFITHRTVISKAERESLNYHYTNGIFISTQIFDEYWDEEKIKEECIKFSHDTFRNRKKSFKTSKETFIKDCIAFIFGTEQEEEDTEVLSLFDCVGSARFPVEYFKLVDKLSPQQVNASLFTFINKISKQSTSVYYKKKAFILEDRIKANKLSAIDLYNLSYKDSLGIADCKFFINLTK